MTRCNSTWSVHTFNIWITHEASIVDELLLNRFFSLLSYVAQWCQWILEAGKSMWRSHEKFSFEEAIKSLLLKKPWKVYFCICKYFQHSTTLLESFLDLNLSNFEAISDETCMNISCSGGSPQVSLWEKVVECVKLWNM